MEKNTILAIALSIGVLITWNVLFPPPPPPEPLPVENVQMQEEEQIAEATSGRVVASTKTARAATASVTTQAVS